MEQFFQRKLRTFTRRDVEKSLKRYVICKLYKSEMRNVQPVERPGEYPPAGLYSDLLGPELSVSKRLHMSCIRGCRSMSAYFYKSSFSSGIVKFTGINCS